MRIQDPSPANATASLAADPFEGTPYRSKGRLADGGMGTVFLVEHRKLGREFVAKILHQALASDPRLVDRMRLEAQSLGRLRHPHIVGVVGFDTTRDGRPFIVLERLRGRSLSDELESRGRLPALEAVTYTCQLLSALEAVHGLGIVHRDIKPENLFICDRPDGLRFLKVLDFGVARVLPGAGAEAPRPLALPTDTGMVVGTPRFVSPEGAMGRRVDQRADVYGAALVLYTLLVGRGPFDHVEGDSNVLSAHAHDLPQPPSAFANESIPRELDAAVLKALQKDPDARYQTVSEFCRDLVRAAEHFSGPGVWSTTDVLRAEAAAAAVHGPEESTAQAPHLRAADPLLPRAAGIGARNAPEQELSARRAGAAHGRSGMKRIALATISLILFVVTAVGVAVLVGAFRGTGGP